MRRQLRSISLSRVNNIHSQCFLRYLRILDRRTAECQLTHSRSSSVSVSSPLLLLLLILFLDIHLSLEKAKAVKSSNESSSDSSPPPRLRRDPDHVSKFHLVANYRPSTDSVLSQKENIFTVCFLPKHTLLPHPFLPTLPLFASLDLEKATAAKEREQPHQNERTESVAQLQA